MEGISRSFDFPLFWLKIFTHYKHADSKQLVYRGAGIGVQRLGLLPNQRAGAFASEYVAQGQTYHDQKPE